MTQVADTSLSKESEYNPKWSPDGNQILFPFRKGIYVVNVDGSDIKKLRYRAGSLVGSPEWSPDGSKIAFVSDDGINIMNADGTKERYLILSDEWRADVWSEWSPDGSKIVFLSKKFRWSIPVPPWQVQHMELIRNEIYVMDADGSNKILLADYWDVVSHPVWLPRKRGVEVTEDSVVIPGPVP